MKNLIIFLALVLCPFVRAQSDQKKDPLTFVTVAQLKAALAGVDQSQERSSAIKEDAKEYLWKDWVRNRAIAEAEYDDNLKEATDAWYANNGDYKKIPQLLWEKLREIDKYEFRHAAPGKEILSTAARVVPAS